MKKNILILGLVVIVIGGFVFLQKSSSEKDSLESPVVSTTDAETSPGEMDEGAAQNLSGLEEALTIAINDEYKARETYDAVLETHGEVKPFSNIIRAEEQHIASLQQLFQTYGLLVPENGWVDAITVTESISDMCAQGVQAEIENAALYREQLLPAVEAYPDVVQVFTNLMNASQNNHLPAFERCSE